MSYEKHVWAVGDKITSARLNNIEDGIKSAVTIVEATVDEDDYYVINMPAKDLFDACQSGIVIVIFNYTENNEDYVPKRSVEPEAAVDPSESFVEYIARAGHNSSNYYFQTVSMVADGWGFIASNDNDFPVELRLNNDSDPYTTTMSANPANLQGE